MSAIPPDVLEALIAIARRSPCRKSRRGAVLVPAGDGQRLAACNEPAVGECDGSAECRRDCARICVHAEEAVLLAAGATARGADVFHLKVVNGEPVASGPPSCAECSKLMLRAGVARVWLLQEAGWRSRTAEEFHRETVSTLNFYSTASLP